ncbi:MAG: hypothetical protein ACLSUM_09815, partial [Dysosmobacter welbionis]
MTTKSLARICEMGRSGACLKEIAQDTGYCISTVGKWLRHQGIGPPGRKFSLDRGIRLTAGSSMNIWT